MKEALEKATVKVVAQVGDEGQLFGSVTTQMIADACKEQADIDVDKRRIELGKPIKTAGEHEVTVSHLPRHQGHHQGARGGRGRRAGRSCRA